MTRQTYKNIYSNCNLQETKRITKILEKHKDNSAKEKRKKEKEYLAKLSYNTSNLYGLSKIHKSKLRIARKCMHISLNH